MAGPSSPRQQQQQHQHQYQRGDGYEEVADVHRHPQDSEEEADLHMLRLNADRGGSRMNSTGESHPLYRDYSNQSSDGVAGGGYPYYSRGYPVAGDDAAAASSSYFPPGQGGHRDLDGGAAAQHGDAPASFTQSDLSLPLYRSRSHSLLMPNVGGRSDDTSADPISISSGSRVARGQGYSLDRRDTNASRSGSGSSGSSEARAGGAPIMSTPTGISNRDGQYQQQPQRPRVRAVDFVTGQSFRSEPPGEQQRARAVEQQSNINADAASHPVHKNSKGRNVDFAQSVSQALSENLDREKGEKGEWLEDRNGGSAPEKAPSLARTMSDYEAEDDNTTFDDYDWDMDDELTRQLDQKYEEEYKKQQDAANVPARKRSAVVRRFSPIHLGKLLLFTFAGNVLLVLLLITPALVVQFLVKNPTSDAHLIYVCDNIQAWCYWVAFNFIAKWGIHAAFEIIPRVFVFIVELIWGDTNETFRGWVEIFNASKGYIKPLFFSGFFWGSFAVTFNSIFDLRSSSDPENSSRAPYTYRVYQVVQLLFFIALVWSIEKIIIRFISLQFHAVAFADRIKDNSFALATIDKLKDYRPKRKTRTAPGTPSATPGSAGFYFGSSHGFGSGHRSGAHTPVPGFLSPRQGSGSTPGTPVGDSGVPPASRHSVWSRLPIPAALKPSSPGTGDIANFRETNPIPLQTTSPHTTSPLSRSQGQSQASPSGPPTHGRIRNDTGYSASSGTATPATPGPGTVETNAEKLVSDKGTKRMTGIFGKKTVVTAQEIAAQALVDPLKTLQNPTLVKNGLGLELGSPSEATKLARNLFYAFRQDPSRTYLITSDFNVAFPTQAEAEAAFSVFDKDGNGDISRPEIRHTILAAYKERRFLARSLQDVSEAVSTLDKLFQVVALLIVFLIAASVFDLDIWSNLTTAYTLAIAVSFIFKSAAQSIFDSVIFLFATHPFDTGDRVSLEGDVYVVKQLGLFSTLFVRWDSTETLISNSKLGQLTITNFRRSPPQFENATLQIGWNTTLEQLDALEAKMNDWLSKDEKRMFAPSTAIVLQNFQFMRYIEVTVGMTHRANWQDWGERWNRRTAFHAALAYYSKECGITYVNSAQPVMYWQSELDNPIPEEEEEEEDDIRSPISPIEGGNHIPAPAAPLQPLMGFLPPEGSTMRKRKGYSKRRGMAGTGA